MNETIINNYNKNFSNTVKIFIRDGILTALKVHSSFIKEHYTYFDTPKGNYEIGRLRTFAVEKQLYLSTFKPDSPICSHYECVNKFGYPALFLETDNFILNISKTYSANQMPDPSLYKLERARYNEEISGQISLPWIIEQKNNEKKYALITYGIDKNNQITHLGIMLPDSKLKCFYNYDSLLELPTIIEGYQFPNSNKEEELVKLKKELITEISKSV